MAVGLSSPPFSFFQLGEKSEPCAWSERPCLPVYDLSDLEFQMIATVDGDNKGSFNSHSISASLTLDCEPSILREENWIGTWTKIYTGTGDEADIWIGNFRFNTDAIWSLVKDNQCFTILLYYVDGDNIACLETCFKKVIDECSPAPTSIIQYSNNENAFGFDYSVVNFANRVRLELYAHSPTDALEQKSYSKSDGSTTKQMARIWKDYRVKTNYFPDIWHERLVVALQHDTVRLTCAYSSLNQELIVCNDKLEIDWQEENIPYFQLAQGKTTVRLAAPRASINSNCN